MGAAGQEVLGQKVANLEQNVANIAMGQVATFSNLQKTLDDVRGKILCVKDSACVTLPISRTSPDTARTGIKTFLKQVENSTEMENKCLQPAMITLLKTVTDLVVKDHHDGKGTSADFKIDACVYLPRVSSIIQNLAVIFEAKRECMIGARNVALMSMASLIGQLEQYAKIILDASPSRLFVFSVIVTEARFAIIRFSKTDDPCKLTYFSVGAHAEYPWRDDGAAAALLSILRADNPETTLGVSAVALPSPFDRLHIHGLLGVGRTCEAYAVSTKPNTDRFVLKVYKGENAAEYAVREVAVLHRLSQAIKDAAENHGLLENILCRLQLDGKVDDFKMFWDRAEQRCCGIEKSESFAPPSPHLPYYQSSNPLIRWIVSIVFTADGLVPSDAVVFTIL
eukprot:Opistho-2@54104